MASLEGASDGEAKLIVVGDSRVGKTCLIARYQENIFSTSFMSTVGMDFIVKNDRIGDRNVNVKIWDTAGQEKFRSLVDSFYVKANGVLLAFDISSRESYDHLDEWYEQIKSKALTDTPIVLIGTKSDLSSKREVDSNEAEKWAKTRGLKYFETTSKHGTNVTEAVHYIALKALEFGKNEQSDWSDDVQFEPLSKSARHEKDGTTGEATGTETGGGGSKQTKRHKNCC